MKKKLLVAALLLVPCLAWAGRQILVVGSVSGRNGGHVTANVVKDKGQRRFYLTCAEKYSVSTAIISFNAKQLDALIKLLEESKREMSKP